MRPDRTILLYIVLLSALSVQSCVPQVSIESINMRTASFEALYQEAVPVAKQWNKDAYLVRARLPVWLENDSRQLSSSFAFHSVEDRDAWLLVHISRNASGNLVIETQTDTFGSSRPPGNPIDIPSSIVSNEEALSTAEKEGVLGEISGNLDAIDSYMILEHQEPYTEEGPMLWNIHFISLESSEFLVVVIDAHTGDFIRFFNPSNS